MKHIILIISIMLSSMQFVSAQRFGDGERGERIKALWVAFVTQELELTSDESAKFWPIYNEFIEKERELQKSKRRLAKKSPSDMSETEVDAYFNQLMTVEEQIVALKRSYYPKLKTAIPAGKIIKLPAIEREFKKKLIKLIQEKRGR
jgi:hypothetical protein